MNNDHPKLQDSCKLRLQQSKPY